MQTISLHMTHWLSMYSLFLRLFLIYLLIDSILLSVSYSRTAHGCSISSAFLNTCPVFIVELICWVDIKFLTLRFSIVHTCSSCYFFFFYFRECSCTYLWIDIHNYTWISYAETSIVFMMDQSCLVYKLFTYSFKFFLLQLNLKTDHPEPFFKGTSTLFLVILLVMMSS